VEIFFRLKPYKIKTIAVIGQNAKEARTGGGGSSAVEPTYAISPLDGLKNKLQGNIENKICTGRGFQRRFPDN
jgi:beta-glucosidase